MMSGKRVFLLVSLAFVMSSSSNYVSNGDGGTEKTFFAAVLLMEQGFFEQALIRLDSVIERDSTNINAYLMKGVCYEKTGSPELALWNYRLGYLLDTANMDALDFLAKGHFQMNNLDSSLIFYKKASEIDPNGVVPRAGILKVSAEMEDWGRVKNSVAWLQTKGYRNAELSFYKGKVSLQLDQDTNSALTDFSSSLAMDSSFGPSLREFGIIMLDRNQMDSSMYYFNRYIDAKWDENGEIHQKRAEVHLLKQDTLQALINLNEVIHLDPQNSHAHYMRSPVKIYYKDSLGACEDLKIAYRDSTINDSTLFFSYNCGKFLD